MVSLIFMLLFAYSVCFGAQNKVDFFHGKFKFTDSMLKCTYCTGFHAGWLSALVFWAAGAKAAMPHFLAVMNPLMFLVGTAFVSAMSCYIVDTLVRWVEAHIPAE